MSRDVQANALLEACSGAVQCMLCIGWKTEARCPAPPPPCTTMLLHTMLPDRLMLLSHVGGAGGSAPCQGRGETQAQPIEVPDSEPESDTSDSGRLWPCITQFCLCAEAVCNNRAPDTKQLITYSLHTVPCICVHAMYLQPLVAAHCPSRRPIKEVSSPAPPLPPPMRRGSCGPPPPWSVPSSCRCCWLLRRPRTVLRWLS